MLRPKSPHVKSKSTYIVALMSATLALYSLVLAYAFILTLRPDIELQRLNQVPNNIDTNLINRMIHRLNISTILNSRDSRTYLLLADYHHILAKENNSKNRESSLLAEHFYKLATQHQPSSNLAWAKLADFHSNFNHHEEAINSIETAVHLGRYEYKSMKYIIPHILKYWPKIKSDKKLSEDLLVALRGIITFNDDNTLLLIDSAAKYRQLDLLRQISNQPWQLNRYNNQVKLLNS